MTDAAIDFWFDFSSPYAWLAHGEAEALAARHGRRLRWRPFLLIAAMKETGARPLMNTPMKGDYARIDVLRTARRLGLPFAPGEPFPFNALAPGRGFYWLYDQDEALAVGWAKRLLTASYAESLRIDRADAALAATAEWRVEAGIDAEALRAALDSQAMKDRLRAESDAAVAAGVFGSPWFVVDGEPFWGGDKLGELSRWLETGGW